MKNLNRTSLSHLAGRPRQWAKSVIDHCVYRLCRLCPSLCSGVSQLRRVAFRFDPESLELQTGVMALALGLWLLGAPSHPEQRPSNFGLMLLRLWPAPVWASLFLVVGAFQMAALTRSGVRARCVCAMSGFLLWSFVAVLLALDGLPGPSVSVFPIVALSEAWVYLRLSVPARCLRSDQRRDAREKLPTPTSVADTHS